LAAQPEHETISVRRIGCLLFTIVTRSDLASHRVMILSIALDRIEALKMERLRAVHMLAPIGGLWSQYRER